MFFIHFETKKRIAWSVALLVYSTWIYYLSSDIRAAPGPLFPYRDKVAHALVYGCLALTAWQVFRQWSAINHPGFWAWLYATLYGATDEWHQYYVPGRTSDPWDLAADTFGAAIFLTAAYFIRQRQLQVPDPPVHFYSPWTPQSLAHKLALRPRRAPNPRLNRQRGRSPLSGQGKPPAPG